MALAKPTQITVPFSSNGVKNTIPETATGSNLASMQEGFPVITMTDVDQGGMPPQGQDMNGILFDVTTAIRYQQAGGLFPFDATFAQTVDGYPLGALLTAADGSCLYQNTVSGNVSDPENGGQGWSQILSSASIAGKQDKLTPVQMDAVNSGITSARVAIYDSYANGKQDALTFDNTPTNGSSNPVTSDGIYTALGTKQDTITFDATPQSGSTNPVQSGGVYDALAEKVNIDNAGNAEVTATGSTTARTLSDWMATLKTAVDCPYKKKVVKELPLKFPDFDTVVGNLSGATWVYPQGFSFDENNNLYIKYDPDITASNSVIVKYNSNYEYQGYFYILSGGEAIVAKGTKLYGCNSNKLQEYDVSSFVSGSTLTGTDVFSAFGIGSQFNYHDGIWIVEQSTKDFGGVATKTVWYLLDDSFNQVGTVFIDKTIVGWWYDGFHDYYPYVPKFQGVTVKDGKIFFSYGGSYINDPAQMAADFGVSQVSYDGSLLSYNVIDAAKGKAVFNSNGYTVTRTECEGISIDADGSVRTMMITALPAETRSSTGGILMLKEYADDGIDFSSAQSAYSPFNIQRIVNSFPLRGAKIYNPITRAEITTLSGLLDFMSKLQLPRTSFYTSTVSLTSISGIPLPASCLVIVNNNNNSSFSLQVVGSGGCANYAVYDNNGTWTVNYPGSDLSVRHLTFIQNDRKMLSHIDGKDDCYLFGANEGESGGSPTGVVNCYYGGASSSYRAVKTHNFWCSETDGQKLGKGVFAIENGAVRGYADGTINLGTSSMLWKELFCANSTINTSDERLKDNIREINDDVLDAWGDVNLRAFQFKDAIEKKGQDARIHAGVIAQQVQSAFEARGLDAFRFGLLCYDEWEAKDAVYDEETGELIDEAVDAGNRYSIRYAEALVLEAAYQRRRADRIEARLAALEERMA